MNEWNLNLYSAFTTVSMFESAPQKTIVYHTLKWLWKMNVFRSCLKVSKSVSLLREIGKEFQSLGAQVERADTCIRKRVKRTAVETSCTQEVTFPHPTDHKAQNRFLPMCSNFASQAEARGAVWKNCVAHYFSHFWYSKTAIHLYLWYSNSRIMHSKLRHDTTYFEAGM
jgi:hypothetical protein